jgi:hypothetical protein
MSDTAQQVFRKLPIAPMRCRGLDAFRRYGVTASSWAALGSMGPRGECKGEVRRMERLESSSPFATSRPRPRRANGAAAGRVRLKAQIAPPGR